MSPAPLYPLPCSTHCITSCLAVFMSPGLAIQYQLRNLSLPVCFMLPLLFHTDNCECQCLTSLFSYRALYFTAYSQFKQRYNKTLSYESSLVHLCSAVSAGIMNVTLSSLVTRYASCAGDDATNLSPLQVWSLPPSPVPSGW